MNYKDFCLEVAKKAGHIMRHHFQIGMHKNWKEDKSPVTQADIEINQMVIDEVKKYYPTHDVQGEEQSSRLNGSKFLWVCDPIDGTIPYSHGIPTSTFSLALVEDGDPIVVVIYDPWMERMYSAEKGKGAFLNDKQIFVNKETDPDKTFIALEYWKRATYDTSDLNKILTKRGSKVTQMCSVLYPGALVALGEISAVIFPGSTNHDAVTMALLIKEAGGKVSDLFGNKQRYDQDIKGFVGSNGLIHGELISIIQKLLVK